MAKSALEELYDLMNDGGAGLANRVRAATAASRVEPLAMGNESEPPAVTFLRSIVNCEHAGLMFHYDHRTAAAQALAYWERRCKKAELQYAVPDTDERTAAWRRIVNSAIRLSLARNGRWPADRHILIPPSDTTFARPPGDPDITLAALLLGGQTRHARRRQKAIDEPIAGGWSGTEPERIALLKLLAEAARRRLDELKDGRKYGSAARLAS